MVDLFLENEVKRVSIEDNEFQVERVDDQNGAIFTCWQGDICICILRIMLYSLAVIFWAHSSILR